MPGETIGTDRVVVRAYVGTLAEGAATGEADGGVGAVCRTSASMCVSGARGVC